MLIRSEYIALHTAGVDNRDRFVAVSAVVLDVFMPGRDGVAALREIRRLNRTVPVIVISDASSPLDVVEAMKNILGGVQRALEEMGGPKKRRVSGRHPTALDSAAKVPKTSWFNVGCAMW